MRPLRALPALLVAVVLAGCGVPVDEAARPLDPSAAPYGVLAGDPDSADEGRQRAVVVFAREGRLVSAVRGLSQHPTAASVLAALTAGPTATERARGLATALPPDAEASVTSVDHGTVTVSLPTAPTDFARVDAALGFGQIVLTLTALPGIAAVVFEHDGEPLQVPGADGALSAGPLTREDYADLVDRP